MIFNFYLVQLFENLLLNYSLHGHEWCLESLRISCVQTYVSGHAKLSFPAMLSRLMQFLEMSFYLYICLLLSSLCGLQAFSFTFIQQFHSLSFSCQLMITVCWAYLLKFFFSAEGTCQFEIGNWALTKFFSPFRAVLFVNLKQTSNTCIRKIIT